MQVTTDTPLTPLQLELLRSFSMPTVDENDLRQIKAMLSQYFFQKAALEAQKVANQKGWSSDEIDGMAKQHSRTPYSSKKPY